MAGQFDIQYNQQTPAVVNQPRANMNVDTGADMLGQAFAHLGESAFGVAMKMKKTQQALEISNMRRKLDETNYAEMAELENAFDDESQRKISDKYEEIRSSIQSKDAEVTSEFTLHANEVMPTFNRGKSQRIVANKQKELTANFEANYNDFLGLGDITSATNLVNSMDFLPKAQRDSLLKNQPVDMAFAQGRKELVTNPQGVINKLSAPDFTSKLSPDQLDARDKLLSIARRQTEVVSSESNKQLTDLYGSQKLTLQDVQARRNQLPDTDYLMWTKITQNPADKKGNRIVAQEFENLTIQLGRGTLRKEDFDRKIRESLADPNGINDEQFVSISSVASKKLEKTQADELLRIDEEGGRQLVHFRSETDWLAAMSSTKETDKPAATEKRQVEFENLSQYNKYMRDWLALHPTASSDQIYKESRVKLKWYKNRTEKQITQAFIGGDLPKEEIATTSKPSEFPDAVWDNQNRMWTVVRNGRKMGVQ